MTTERLWAMLEPAVIVLAALSVVVPVATALSGWVGLAPIWIAIPLIWPAMVLFGAVARVIRRRTVARNSGSPGE